MKNVCLVLSLLVLFGSFANAAVLFSENFDDGNIDDWTYTEYFEGNPGTHDISAEGGFLSVMRLGSSNSGGGPYGNIGIEKLLDIPVDQDTEILFDVKAVYNTLPLSYYETGDNQAYPIKVRLSLETLDGPCFLSFAYNYNGGSDASGGNLYRVGVGDAPQGVWMRDEAYRICDYFPLATSISQIRIVGKGWDFESQIDNVSIVVPEPLTISMLLAGLPLLRKRK